MKFARRTNWPLETNDLSFILADLEKQGASIINLTESNPTCCGFSYPSEILEAFNHKDNLSYKPDPRGMLKVRQALSAMYQSQGISLPAERLFLTSSTSEAYSFLFRLLCNPGETVLFPRPSYPLFQFLVDLNDLKMGFYTLRYETSWRIDFKNLEQQIDSSVRGLVVVNPNNPTGSYIHQAEIEQLNVLARKHNLFLISDEVFFDYAWQNKSQGVSLLYNTQTLSFVLSGVSKMLALPQMKLSWIGVQGPVSDAAEAMKRLEVLSDTYLSVNTPVQNALPSWLSYKDTLQKSVKARVAKNLECLTACLVRESSLKLLSSEGGWYAVCEVATDKSEEELVTELLTKDQVLVHPGYFFDFEDGVHLVLSLLPEEKMFKEGLARILNRLKV